MKNNISTIIVHAKIGGNKKGISTTNPLILLDKIVGFSRKHCWVKYNSAIQALNLRGDYLATNIVLECKVVQYTKAGESMDTLEVLKVVHVGNQRRPRKSVPMKAKRKKSARVILV